MFLGSTSFRSAFVWINIFCAAASLFKTLSFFMSKAMKLLICGSGSDILDLLVILTHNPHKCFLIKDAAIQPKKVKIT